MKKVDTDIIVNKVNLFLQNDKRYRKPKDVDKYSTKLLISTGFAANTIEGGAIFGQIILLTIFGKTYQKENIGNY